MRAVEPLGATLSTENIQPIRPSETTDFIRCAKYWSYKHLEGWEPPASAWTPERLIGSALHAGLASHWGTGGTLKSDAFIKLAFERDWPPDAPLEFSRDALEAHTLKVLDKVLAWIAKEMPDAQPVMVEQSIGPDGHTTPDLVTRENGQLVVTDWKYTHQLDADRIRYRLEGIERTHQFLHYCWVVSEHLKEPVRLFRKVVIVGGPRILVRDATFTPQPEAIEYWLTGARQMWEDMAEMRAGTRVAWQNVNGCTIYGPKWPCQFWEACWTCHGDKEKMRQFYLGGPAR